MKHTPGPWIADGNFVYALNEQQVNRFSLSLCKGYSDIGRTSTEELAANARLIAAAPELLEVLERLYTDALDRGETTDFWDQEYDDWRAVRLVIAKAKGE